jgi:hypothetical protein
MGFSGGGSNVLKPHTHDGSIAQDGGSLNANNITQMGMGPGDVMYSDGNHLQILAYPGVPAGETLTAAAASTSPSWSAGGGAVWTQVFSEVRTSAVNTWTETFTAIPQNDYALFCLQFQCGFDNDSDILVRFHDSSGAITTGYYSDGMEIGGGVSAILDDNNVAFARVLQVGNGRKTANCTVFFTMGNSTYSDTENEVFSWWSTGIVRGGTGAFSSQGGTVDTNPITSLNGITAYANAVGGANVFEIGSKMTLWKIA